MDIGRLSSKVTLQSPPTAQDALGQPSGAWVTEAATWAEIRHLSGLQAIKGGAETSTVKASARLRYRSVSAGWRLVFGEVTYNVLAVMPDARRRFVDLVIEVVQ